MLLSKVKQILFSEVDILSEDISEDTVRMKAYAIMENLIEKEGLDISPDEKARIVKAILDEIFGYGILSPLMIDENITEIMINGPDKVYVEVNGKKHLSGVRFSSHQHLMRLLERMLSHSYRRVDELSPYADFSLPDGSRVNVIIPPVSATGPVITIRKFLRSFNTIEDLMGMNTLNDEMARFLIAAVQARLNIIFSGATGAGKTTTLGVLLNYIDQDERLVVIEDTLELSIDHPHTVRLEARQAGIEGRGEVTIRDLFKNSLRMRPDRIIIGEMRAEESLDLLQAISSGHHGSLGVLHASNPNDAVSRLETMVVIYNHEIPLWLVQRQIISALDIIVQHERMKDGVRRITHISEVNQGDNGQVVCDDIFRFEQDKIEDGKIYGLWKKMGREPQVAAKIRKMGVEVDPAWFM